MRDLRESILDDEYTAMSRAEAAALSPSAILDAITDALNTQDVNSLTALLEAIGIMPTDKEWKEMQRITGSKANKEIRITKKGIGVIGLDINLSGAMSAMMEIYATLSGSMRVKFCDDLLDEYTEGLWNKRTYQQMKQTEYLKRIKEMVGPQLPTVSNSFAFGPVMIAILLKKIKKYKHLYESVLDDEEDVMYKAHKDASALSFKNKGLRSAAQFCNKHDIEWVIVSEDPNKQIIDIKFDPRIYFRVSAVGDHFFTYSLFDSEMGKIYTTNRSFDNKSLDVNYIDEDKFWSDILLDGRNWVARRIGWFSGVNQIKGNMRTLNNYRTVFKLMTKK